MAIAKQFFGKSRYNWYVVSRLVILPDFQGIGLGTRFLRFATDLYRTERKCLSIVTSARNLILSLNKQHWSKMTRFSVVSPDEGKHVKHRTVKTATFVLVGEANGK